MPINSSGVPTAQRALNTLDGQPTGVVHKSDFAVCDDVNPATQVKLAVTNVPAGTAVTIEAPAGSGTLALEGVSSLQYSAPVTGATVALESTTSNLIVNPAGTIAALTITLPAASDGKIFTISSSQIITALTLTPAGSDTIKNDVTAMTAGQAFSLIARSTVWYQG
jgi:hypothetical protein